MMTEVTSYQLGRAKMGLQLSYMVFTTDYWDCLEHTNLLSIPSKRLDGNIGCQSRTSSWHLIGFPDGSNIGSTVYNVGEKPSVYCTRTLIP